jgi:hypothetical protein
MKKSLATRSHRSLRHLAVCEGFFINVFAFLIELFSSMAAGDVSAMNKMVGHELLASWARLGWNGVSWAQFGSECFARATVWHNPDPHLDQSFAYHATQFPYRHKYCEASFPPVDSHFCQLDLSFENFPETVRVEVISLIVKIITICGHRPNSRWRQRMEWVRTSGECWSSRFTGDDSSGETS